MQNTFTVPAARLETLIARLNKLTKKANKYGNEPIGYTIGAKTIVEKMIHNNGNRPHMIQVEMVDIIVWGNAPKYGEYTFAAKVEFMAGGENIVHNMANIQLDNRFRTMISHCDHCGHNRVRNNVFVFVNQNGEQMAVGSSCLHDFTGCDNPLEIANRATFAADIQEICDEEDKEYFGSFGEAQFTTKELLQSAAANVREYGWVSKANALADEGIMSTADRVMRDMFPNGKWTPVEINDADCAIADEAIQYFRNAEMFANDYLNNIRVIMKSDIVVRHHVGIIVSAVNVIIKEKAKAVEKNIGENTSEYFGEINSRYANQTLKFIREVTMGDNGFGMQYMYSFEDINGNQFTWFTSKKDFEIGNEYKMDFTVKAHKEYRGAKQTNITRAKVK